MSVVTCATRTSSFSDIAGNDERTAFVYDATKLAVLEEIGEIAVPPAQYRFVKLPGITRTFDGFDRNPHLVAFRAGAQNSISFVNVHLYHGSEKPAQMARRALETFAVARWAGAAPS